MKFPPNQRSDASAQPIYICLGANASDNQGVRNVDTFQKVGNLEIPDPKSRPYRHGFYGCGYSGNLQEVRGPESTISLSDLGRRFSLWKFPISRRRGGASRQYICSWAPTCLTTWGPPGRYSPESWSFAKFGPRIAPFSTWALGRGVQWGVARKRGARN